MLKSKPILIGIFGGTFDPIHYGHLRVAEEVVRTIGLQKIYFVPAGIPRLRNAPIASPKQRTEAVRLAIQDNPNFVLDKREIYRDGISFSIDSIYEFKQEFGEEIGLCFILGADAFIKFSEWDSWKEFFNLCHFIISTRPGYTHTSINDLLPKELKDECSKRWVINADDMRNETNGLIFISSATMLDISATSIRKNIAAGKSVRYLVPDVAINYILESKLYL
ncbi:MAG: nicotinic acid mononucleotide adenylyltransferase [Nitrosomonadaceae bacterium]|nr:nicotinic acid mononucleotide adenylyltransferase [Nitrosomonadaceae bacterium]|tara:strand:- start:1529 stop:2194 length:666 start_codon:yes stop_codon:yes gene_type:complete